MLAAYGLKLLRSGPRLQRHVARGFAVAAGAAVILLALWLPRVQAVRHLIPGGKPVAAALLIPCAFALAAVVAAAGLIRTRVGALLIVGVVAADLFFSFGGFYEWREVG